MKKIVLWLDDRLPLLSVWKNIFTEYYAPKNLNFLYYFGFLATFILLNQILTGLWLTMFYTPTAEGAFASIEYIMRDVNFGWLLRYMHSTGASCLFIVVYLHMFRGILYGSYQKPRELLWWFGMILFVLLLAEAFFGYLLPWGQMSYWGAQVITSLFGALPYIGESLVTWLRGDYHVGNSTLQRFFALHVIGLPLLILLLVVLHLIALRKVGSNNPEGIEIKKTVNAKGIPLDGIPFYPYYMLKDFVSLLVFLTAFFAIIFFVPEMGGYFLESDNFIKANPMVTPEHIAPVWYMTPFYTILRAIPNKLVGIIIMGSAILILFLLPWLDRSPVKSMRYKGWISYFALIAMICSFVTLGYLGRVVLTPFTQYLAQICAIIYFGFFLLMPIYSRWESHKVLPSRIKS
jgi:ubiquinol-cytochrome c reductase cytochrome b subunit